MNLEIRFGKTKSTRLADAVRQAEQIPGFTKRDGAGGSEMVVFAKVPFDDPELWWKLESLLGTVRAWQSTVVLLDGSPVDPLELSSELGQVLSCYWRKQGSDASLDYCSGKDTPTADISFFGCRLINGVNLHHGDDDNIPWYEFGQLSTDQKRFAVDHHGILSRLRHATTEKLCVSCPAFSWIHVAETVACLPTVIDLEESQRFQLKFSRLDPSKPSGIEPRRNSGALTIHVGENNCQQAILPVRNIPKVFYNDIAAQDDAVGQLRDVCELPLKYPDYFAQLGLTPHTGVILFGPSGNGKTLMAQAVATETEAHLEIISGPEILSKWVGQSEENLRQVFARARTSAPSIVLIDELDAIAPHRGRMIHQYEIRLVSQLLALLDGIQERGRVIVIGTTNRMDAVDPAIKRPGRFDYHIQVTAPNVAGRAAILRLHLSRLKCETTLDVADTVASTPGWSGAELAAIVREAGVLAIKRAISASVGADQTRVTEGDLRNAVMSVSAKRS